MARNRRTFLSRLIIIALLVLLSLTFCGCASSPAGGVDSAKLRALQSVCRKMGVAADQITDLTPMDSDGRLFTFTCNDAFYDVTFAENDAVQTISYAGTTLYADGKVQSEKKLADHSISGEAMSAVMAYATQTVTEKLKELGDVSMIWDSFRLTHTGPTYTISGKATVTPKTGAPKTVPYELTCTLTDAGIEPVSKNITIP